MASIDKAYCDSSKSILSIDEIADSPNFDEIRYLLNCSTSGCHAKLDFVNGQNENFLRTHRNENHIEDCPHYFERNASKLKSKKLVEISVSMGEGESDTRLDYLYNSIYKKKSGGRTTSRITPNKTISDDDDEQEHVEAVLSKDSSNNQDLSELKKKSKVVVRGPKTYNRALNQITDKDIFVKSYAYADSAVLKESNCEIKVHYGQKIGLFKFPNTFFSEYVQAQEFMETFVRYINLPLEQRYPIMLLVLGEVKEIAEKDTEQILYVNKYPWLKIVVENTTGELPPKLKLTVFINLLDTDVFKKDSD